MGKDLRITYDEFEKATGRMDEMQPCTYVPSDYDIDRIADDLGKYWRFATWICSCHEEVVLAEEKERLARLNRILTEHLIIED